jgi:Rha family phage regulatory protein
MEDFEMEIIQINGKPVVTSQDVAKTFGKKHFHVLRNIEKILKTSDKFGQSNFGFAEYSDGQGKSRKQYHLTKDGFVLLAMGFTGDEAMKLKVSYITQFNAMEKFIQEQLDLPQNWNKARLQGKVMRRTLTDAIKECLIPAAMEAGSKNYSKFYVSYTKMINQIYIDDSEIDIEKGTTVRNYLNSCELSILGRIEKILADIIIDEVEKGNHYKEIYQKCKDKVIQIAMAIGQSKPQLPNKSGLALLPGGKS